MFSESRIAIYDFLKPLFAEVSPNVYPMRVPTENTESDTKDGFIVIQVGGINDESEFGLDTFGWVRCYVTAYVPQKKRGRLDTEKYAMFENGINAAIRTLVKAPQNDSLYFVQPDGILSMDDEEDTNKGNQYNVFVKSFIVVTNNQE